MAGYGKNFINLGEFGLLVKQLRETKGYTLREFGKMSGFQHNDIMRIEKGELNLSVTRLNRITRALNIKISFYYDLD